MTARARRRSPPSRRAGDPPLPTDVGQLQRLIRKQSHDFGTILEVATQINARVLDDRQIETYLQFLSNYLTTLARGQFGVSKAYLFRQPDLDAERLVLPAGREDGAAPLTFELGGAFGRLIQKHRAPFRLEDAAAGPEPPPELEVLRELGVHLCVPLVSSSPTFGADLKGLLGLGPKLVAAPFTPSEIRFIGLLANMAAVAIHNAQLHR
jgi:GAF domain-containing protein